MRCDLHVHTMHSGMCTVPLMRKICRESYNDPLEVYRTLKKRGMDLITVTDHDSIDAVEQLRAYPDFFLSEEVSCVTPDGTNLHVGVYDITDRDHVALQQRRADLPSLLAYAREHRLVCSVNHPFSSLTGPRATSDFRLFERSFAALETLNGQMLPWCNRASAALAARTGKISLAGSDAHTLASLGLTYTQVAGAHNKREFFDGLRQGQASVRGQHGSYCQLTGAVWSIGCKALSGNPWMLLLSPMLAAIPIATLANVLLDRLFVAGWEQRARAGEFTDSEAATGSSKTRTAEAHP